MTNVEKDWLGSRFIKLCSGCRSVIDGLSHENMKIVIMNSSHFYADADLDHKECGSTLYCWSVTVEPYLYV